MAIMFKESLGIPLEHILRQKAVIGKKTAHLFSNSIRQNITMKLDRVDCSSSSYKKKAVSFAILLYDILEQKLLRISGKEEKKSPKWY